MDNLQKLAGDLDENTNINLLDILFVRRKLSFQPVPQWSAPDYVFEVKVVEVHEGNFNVEINIKGLCSGDVNGSFVPAN